MQYIMYTFAIIYEYIYFIMQPLETSGDYVVPTAY